jgi:hypothetical protein
MLVEENQKIMKIVGEFSIFLLDNGIDCLDIKIRKGKNKVSLIFDCANVTKEMLEEITHSFKVKRQEAIEFYGWELLGCGDTEEDLELASTLVNYLTYYHIEERTRFNLVRYEKHMEILD